MTIITCTFDTDTHKVVPIEPESQVIFDAWLAVNRGHADHEVLRGLYRAMIAAAPPYPADVNCKEILDGWISVDDGLPAMGQVVDLCINGVVQNETYIFDACDSSDYGHVQYFWSREDDPDGLDIESDQLWKARPLPPAPKGE